MRRQGAHGLFQISLPRPDNGMLAPMVTITM
jgi:hypothetical protein